MSSTALYIFTFLCSHDLTPLSSKRYCPLCATVLCGLLSSARYCPLCATVLCALPCSMRYCPVYATILCTLLSQCGHHTH